MLTDEQKKAAREAWELDGHAGVFMPFAAMSEDEHAQIYAVYAAALNATDGRRAVLAEVVMALNNVPTHVEGMQRHPDRVLEDCRARVRALAAIQGDDEHQYQRRPSHRALPPDDKP